MQISPKAETVHDTLIFVVVDICLGKGDHFYI